jgi:hypothetical protein
LIAIELKRIQSLHLVDRSQVQSLLEELQLTPADFFDNLQARKAGQLLGAGLLISGGAERLSDTHLQLSAGVVEAETGKLRGDGVRVQGAISEVVALTNKIVLTLLDDLGVSTSDAVYRSLRELPTVNALAFIAFSKGLDYEDRNLVAQARFQYGKALKLDPSFNLAKQRLAQLPESRLSISEMEKLVSFADPDRQNKRSVLWSAATASL